MCVRAATRGHFPQCSWKQESRCICIFQRAWCYSPDESGLCTINRHLCFAETFPEITSISFLFFHILRSSAILTLMAIVPYLSCTRRIHPETSSKLAERYKSIIVKQKRRQEHGTATHHALSVQAATGGNFLQFSWKQESRCICVFQRAWWYSPDESGLCTINRHLCFAETFPEITSIFAVFLHSERSTILPLMCIGPRGCRDAGRLCSWKR